MMRLGFRWVLIPFLLLCFRGVCFCNQAPHGTPATPVAGPAAEKFFNALNHAQQQWLKNHPVIRIGFAPERPPFEFIDGQGQQSGLAADYLDLIAKRLNVRFKRVDKDDGSLLSWAEIQEAGRKKELDVIVSLIQTETRDVYLNFTRPYLEFPWALIVNDSSDTPREITDFLGQPVAVIASYPVRGQLSRLYPGLVFIPVDTPLQGLIAVARGRAAVFVTNAAEAAYFIKNASLSQLKIVGVVPEMDARLRMGVRKDWPVLTEILDKAIASLTPRETTEIHNRWISLDFNSGVDWEKMLTVAVPAVLVVLIFIVVGVIVNRRLQSEVVKRRQTEEDLRFALETADAYYFQFDLKKDTVTYSSINTFLRHGYSEENIPRTNEAFFAFVHPDDVALKDEKNKEYMEKKLPSIQFPFRFRKPDYNGWFWINTTYRCTEWDENGEPVKFVGLHQDITERQTLLEQVKSSSEQLSFALEAAGAYSWQVDKPSTAISYNSLHLFISAGYSEEEAPTTIDVFYSLLHPDDIQTIQGLFADIFQGRCKSAKTDYRFRHKHSGWMWLHSAGRATEWDASGQVTKITGLTMDITEQYALTEEIRKSQERLRIISEHTYDWQSWLDLSGRLVWINQAVERITGYSVEECMAMKDYPRHLIDDRDWELFLEVTQEALREQEHHECILRIRCKDGTRIWVSAAYEPVLDKNGQVTGLAGAAKDITKQKEAERGLHLMLRVFEDGADPIIITDLSGIILDLNEAAITAYGYSRDELAGKKIGVLVSKEANIRGDALFQRCINGEILKNIEGERIRKDGTRIPQLFTFSLLKNDEGKPLGIASIAKDITELKQAEKELKDYRDHLEELVKKRTADLEEAKLVAEEATKAKSDFLANMSHEIRTPLNAIIGFSHLARQTELDVIQSDYIRKIETGSKALLGVINDILDFSKIEAGKLSMEDIEFSLEDVLETVTNLVGIRAQEKGLEVVYNIDPALPLKLIGDPVRMGQILLNLTNNAVKFTETGEIVIGCSLLASDSDEVQLKFYVQDSGIGLTREQQNKLFQAFAQADSSTTRKYGGTGLGLFISKFLVEMMKGRIWVESVYGQGTTFFFTVRLKCAGLSTITSDLHDTDIQHKKVLVVDDNYISRTVLEKMLEAMSFTVIQAESAEAGFAELEAAEKSNEPFALVLMDWKMPGMDGLHAAAQIKSSMKENIPSIIMVSAYAREELMREANRMGLSGYLIKPVSPSLLSDSIMSALGGKNLSRSSGWQAGEGLPSVAAIRGAKLLVAEDNEVNQQVARGILENNGFIVDIADNGLLAVEALEYAVYDAVLMDINMPEMDGYTAARQIRKDPKFNDLPIIAMTANAMTGDREKALDAGMNDHVAKPIDVKDLLSVLGKWVRPVGKALHPSVDLAQVPSPQVNKETETAVGGFGPLPGIDVADGLARLGGDSRLYRDLLNKFAQNHADTADRILSALSVADMETAQRLAHTIKGVAGNIGAKPLFNVVTQVDTALKEADIDTAHSLLGAFEVCLTQTIEGINAMAQQTRSDPAVQVLQPHAPDFTPEAIRPILITLSKMLEDNDTDAGTIVRQLKAVIQEDVSRNLVAQLAGKISGYDFDGAAQLLQALCRELGIKLE